MADARDKGARKGPKEGKGPADSGKVPSEPTGPDESKRRSGSAPADRDSADEIRRRQREEIDKDVGDARSASPDEVEYEPEA